MIISVYRGNGLTELIEESEYELEKSHKADKQSYSNISFPAANSGEHGQIKGCYVGRDGRAVLLDRLLCGGRSRGRKKKMAEVFTKKQLTEHPKHYNRKDAMECWDEMELIWGSEALILFCEMNAWKYRYRAAEKDSPDVDLKKSDVYMKKAYELKNRVNYAVDSIRRGLETESN